MVRLQYGNCATCHVSPSGGGLVTNYGNSLSAEVLSFIEEPEKKPQFPSWINLGGDVRSIQLYENTPAYTDAKYFMMQEDLTVAVGDPKKWQVVGTAGLIPDDTHKKFGDRSYYLLVKPAENFSLRFGKFNKIYGINTAEHAITTRRGLGWDEGSETYNGEFGYTGAYYDAFLTYIDGIKEKGYAASSSLFLFNRHKLGISYFKGEDRRVSGLWMINGWTESLFTHAEVDRTSANGEVWYCKEGWSARRGVVLYLTQDLSKANISSDLWDWQAYGVGIQLFPRTHYELNLQYQKRASTGESFSDYAYAMMHVYL